MGACMSADTVKKSPPPSNNTPPSQQPNNDKEKSVEVVSNSTQKIKKINLKPHKKYLIVNVATGKALDWARTTSERKEIKCCSLVPDAPHHQWVLTRFSDETFNIKTADEKFAIDGHFDETHPAAVLKEPSESAHNQRWKFTRIAKEVYTIVNVASNKTLESPAGSDKSDELSAQLVTICEYYYLY
jgi:hypothetical protein